MTHWWKTQRGYLEGRIDGRTVKQHRWIMETTMHVSKCPADCTETLGEMFGRRAILFLRNTDGHCCGYRWITGHTPGPWQLHELSAAESEILAPFGIETRAPIAILVHLDEEEVANARLIAAAPDLLAALKAVYGCSIYPPCEKCGSGQAIDGETIKLVRAAIARARGEE